MKRFALCLLPVVAACSSPLESCVSRASAPLTAVQSDIARTAGNLERGYAVHRSRERVSPVFFCSSLGRSRSNVGVFVSGCTPTSRTVERPVAIDAGLEERRLAALRQQEVTVRAQVQPQIARCYDVFQSGG